MLYLFTMYKIAIIDEETHNDITDVWLPVIPKIGEFIMYEYTNQQGKNNGTTSKIVEIGYQTDRNNVFKYVNAYVLHDD